MHKKYLTFLSVITLLTFVNLYPQNKDYSGIKFNSQNVQRSEKTSIFLNEGKSIELENSFSISFDISFWNTKYYGPILRISDEKGNEIKVIHNQHREKEISYFDIIESSHNHSIQIPFFKKDLIRNKWFNIKITFDKNENCLKVYSDKTFRGKISYDFKNQRFYDFVFGIKKLGNPMDFDVPGISIKNILITGQGKQKYFWGLNLLDDNAQVDKINGAKLKLVNPVWVYEEHKKWRKLADIKISDHSMAHLGVAYDSLNSRLFIDGREDLIIYDLITGRDLVIKYKTKSPAFWNDLFYDNNQQLLYSHFTAMGKVSVYDIKKNEWIAVDTAKNPNGHYFGSVKFSYPKDNDLFLLGGYGWYKVKNDLFKYNFINKEWEKVKLKKNEMTPRAWLTFGRGFKEGEYLIYGGFGNETGVQEHGFTPYSDLFLLNMNDSTITKLKLPEQQKFQFSSLYNNLYLDKEDSSFYFLSQNEEGKLYPVTLNKLELKTGKVYPVGNKFSERIGGKWIYSYLHYNKSTNELISVIFDSTNVEIYSINYPPISESEKIYTEQEFPDNSQFIILLSIFSIMAGVVAVYFFIRRKKQKLIKQSSSQIIYAKDNQLENRRARNSIQLFGGFHIYNNVGKDIILDFSPKLKEILLLILLRSFNHYQHKGITSEELSTIIWPDSSPESVKSSRGVAINKIRKLLSETEGIDIQFDEKVWTVNLSSSAGCDYLNYLSLKNSINKNDNLNANLTDSLFVAIEGGEFLKGISYEWLDPIKVSINNEIILLVKRIWEFDNIKTDNSTLIKLCETILKFDSVDEEAIKLLVRTLCLEGKNSLAKSKYQIFVAEHKRLYDENYSQSFQELTS